MQVDYYSGRDAQSFAEECAAIHTAAFSAFGTRGWSTDEIKSLFERGTTFLLKNPHGFLIADLLINEVEILTIAVAPAHQGQKIGYALLRKLEVAEDNFSAIGLYKGFNYQKFAIRESYFKRKNSSVAALLMSKNI